MAIPSYPITTFIQGSACIGDSRTTINANFSALDFNLTSLNTSVSTASLSARFITLVHSPFNDGTNPNLFIGEVGDGTAGSVLGSLSGFNTYYDENSNKYIISTQFGTTSPLTALAISQTAQVGINTASPNQALTVNGVISATGNIYGTYYDGNGGNSNQWDTTYATVCALSGNWNTAYVNTTGLQGLSGNWQSVYSLVNTTTATTFNVKNLSATGFASVSALQLNNTTTQTTLLSTLTTTRKFPIYDAGGTLLGYVPICSF